MDQWARIYATDPDYAHFFQVVINDGHLYLATDPDNGEADVARNLDLTFDDGAWHHLAAVRDGADASDAAIYVDGAPIALEAYDGYFSGSDSTRIGAHSTGAFAYSGLLDEIAIWRRTLTAGEILDLYESAFSSGLLEGDVNADYNGAGNLDHWIRCDNMGVCPHQCLVRILENGEEAIKEESPIGVV